MDMDRPYFGMSTVILMGPEDETVLVIENRPSPKWKFPGGKIERIKKTGSIEKPSETAIREVWEETGIRLLPKNLELIETRFKSTRRGYLIHYFAAQVSDYRDLQPRGVTGERTMRYPLKKLPYDIDRGLLEGKEILDDHITFLKTFCPVLETV